MTISEIREKILTDDAFVLEETRKIQYLYGLQNIIRYHLQREEKIKTESVAEHIYAMSVLAHYFAPLEDNKRCLDYGKLNSLITWHDIDEIETGDVIGYLKTDADRAGEAQATETVLKNSPSSLQPYIKETLTEYKKQETFEARFIKAIDKLDPVFAYYTKDGHTILNMNSTTAEQHSRIKEPYLEEFPVMFRFYRVITDKMIQEGYLQI